MKRIALIICVCIIVSLFANTGTAAEKKCTVTFRSIELNTGNSTAMLHYSDEVGYEKERTVITLEVDYGYILTEHDVPGVYSCTPGTYTLFDHWSTEPLGACITDDTEFIAYCVYQYEVFFNSTHADVFGHQLVEHGKDAIPPTIPQNSESRILVWAQDYTNVTQHMNIWTVYRDIGDCNIDGIVNTADAVEILKITAEMKPLLPDRLAVADMNKDGIVNTEDAVAVLRCVIGM